MCLKRTVKKLLVIKLTHKMSNFLLTKILMLKDFYRIFIQFQSDIKNVLLALV